MIQDAGLPHVEFGDRIPRLIHQTFSTADLPVHLRRNVDEMISSNPGWEHRLYDDRDCAAFIAECYGPEILAAYLKIEKAYGAARADLFRYLLMYRKGGVYLDIKSRFTRPIDQIVRDDDRFIRSQWRNAKGELHEGCGLNRELAIVPGGEYQQWHIIAAPGHPFLRAVIRRVLANIETYRPWRHGVGRIGVLRLTGPIAYTRAIFPLIGDRRLYRAVPDESHLALEYTMSDGYQHVDTSMRHYSQLDTSIIELPWRARLPSRLYSMAKRFRDRKIPAASR